MAGSRDFIEQAWQVKQQFGGAMRQSGVLAAMCLYALDHHVERLADDHALAAKIAGRIRQMPKVAGMLPVETNIVFFDIAEDGPDAADVVRLCRDDGIIIGAFGKKRIRLVTHLDVDETAAEALCTSLAKHLS